jgi:EAL domain-containing protein (putative c-di-GMP-specific phosphodiesterase class I)
VDDINSDDSDRIIAGAVIALGRAMGLDVIAEGIEHEEQARALRDLGCTQFQGFLYGMPMYTSRIETVLRKEAQRKTAP